MQPRVICGRNALSLIVGDTCDEAAHLHAAKARERKPQRGEIGSNVQRQFAQHLFISTVLLSDTNIPDDSLIQ